MKPFKQTKTLLILPALGLLSAAALSGCSHGGSTQATAASQPPTPVVVAPVKTGTIAQLIDVTGNLSTLFTINLSPQTAGKLVNVFVREGDPVHAGEVVAQIDPTAAEAEVRQDQANVESAVAKLDQARATYEQAKVAAQVTIVNAKSSLAAAKINLEKTKVGDQPQQKQQAVDEVLQQQANFDNAQAAYQREIDLYNHGAVALSDLQNAETTYNTQKALLDNYQQNLSMVNEGGRPEDVATAEQTVLQSQQDLEDAYANQATVNVDEQAIAAAVAGVDQAKAALVSADQDLANCNLVSTINGVVSERNQDPGAIAQPGTTVLQIVDLHTVYYEPTVSEDQFNQIAPGQQVIINVDAYPGRQFMGKVTDIFPAASTTDRQFSIRVTIPNNSGILRPGMYARGSITTAVHRGVVVIPVAAMLPQSVGSGFQVNTSSSGIATGGTSLPPQMVYLAGSDGKAHAQNITVGIVNGDQAEVTSGLSPGDPLIVKGQGDVQDGDPISVSKRHHRSAGQNGQSGADAAGGAPSGMTGAGG